METPRQIADRFLQARKPAWERRDPTTVIVTTETMNPDDEQTLWRMVSDAGYTGLELEEMVRSVTGMVVRRVEALNDHMPVTDAD